MCLFSAAYTWWGVWHAGQAQPLQAALLCVSRLSDLIPYPSSSSTTRVASIALYAAAVRLKGSKDGLAGQVLQDLLVGASVVQRPGVAPTQLMLPDRVCPTELPVYCPQAYVKHQSVDKGLYADFSALQAQPYQVCVVQGSVGLHAVSEVVDTYCSCFVQVGLAPPVASTERWFCLFSALQAEFEHKLLGYEPEEVPSLLAYVPLCQDQPLLSGAAEDLPGGMQCGVLPGCLTSLSCMDAMPTALLRNPYPSRSHQKYVQVGLIAAGCAQFEQQVVANTSDLLDVLCLMTLSAGCPAFPVLGLGPFTDDAASCHVCWWQQRRPWGRTSRLERCPGTGGISPACVCLWCCAHCV